MNTKNKCVRHLRTGDQVVMTSYTGRSSVTMVSDVDETDDGRHVKVTFPAGKDVNTGAQIPSGYLVFDANELVQVPA